MSIRRKIFYSLTVTVIALLLLLPQTGWLARMQLAPYLCGGIDGLRYRIAQERNDNREMESLERRMVDAHPDDLDIQFAHASWNSSAVDIKTLTALSLRFPNEPMVIANQLKTMSLPIDWPAEEKLFDPSRPDISYTPQVMDAATLAQYEALAAAGERREPDNAYFPVMRAAGYFMAHRDFEGIAAWARAGRCTAWNTYAGKQEHAYRHLQRYLVGGSREAAITRVIEEQDVLPLSAAQIETAASMAIAEAIRAELAGKFEVGFQIRRATRCIGERIQEDAMSFADNWTGSEILQMADVRPGGTMSVPWVERTEYDYDVSATTLDAPEKIRRDADARYLVRIGHPDESAVFLSDLRMSEQIFRIERAGRKRSYTDFGDRFNQLGADWIADILLIAGAVFALAFGGVFGLVYRFSPRLQKGEPLQKSARWAVATTILGCAVWLTAAITAECRPHFLAMYFALAGIVWVVVSLLRARLTIREFGHAVAVILATMAAIAAVFSAGAAVTHCFEASTGVLSMFKGPECSWIRGECFWGPTQSMLVSFVAAGIVLSVPLLMLAVFVIFSRIMRIPVASGVTRGMRALSVPLACLLMLCWSVCLVATLHQETAAGAECDYADTHGELQTFAHLLGEKIDPAATESNR